MQTETHSCMHTKHAVDLSSPFLPVFGGPAGLSVTDAVNKRTKKTKQQRTQQAFWTTNDFILKNS